MLAERRRDRWYEHGGDPGGGSFHRTALFLYLGGPDLQPLGPTKILNNDAHTSDRMDVQEFVIPRSVRLSSPSYIEQMARDQLDLCFPGAQCYIVAGERTPVAWDGVGAV